MAEHNLHEKVEKIEGVEKVGTPKLQELDVTSAEEVSAPTRVKFDDAVAKAESKWDHAQKRDLAVASTEENATKLSPIVEMSVSEKRIERLKPVTVEQVVQYADGARDKIRTAVTAVEDAQKSPNARISPAHDAILTDKLIHIDSSLKTSLSKVGVEVQAQDIAKTGQPPLVKFLNYLSNGDRQLNTLVTEIQSINVTKERLTPEKLLAVQIKLNFVQQELEFFTNVLNKAVEGTKTIMNVQV
jgi:hypothetical protein